MSREAIMDRLISRHFPPASLSVADVDLSAQDCREFLDAKALYWLRVEHVTASQHMTTQAKAFVYAGKNPMAHHAPQEVKYGGMDGALEVFNSLMDTRSKALVAAGSYLTSAREYRALGKKKLAAGCMTQAAAWRRIAQRHSPTHQIETAAIAAE